jgi:ubiquinone/menaquinone biosynthesis C-methylase UbiE
MTQKKSKAPEVSVVNIDESYLTLPWKLKSESVDEITCFHLFQRIPGKQRAQFMDEVYRVLKPAGKATFVTPYWSSMRSTGDPRFEWPPISELSYLYFNKQWRADQKITLKANCDFDFTYGYVLDPAAASRTIEVQQDWAKYRTNAVNDLQVILTKRV